MAPDYAPRILDQQLREALSDLAAVALDGAKAVGKTSTARQVARTVLELDVAEQAQLLQAGPALLSTAPTPLLLDEWQRLPEVWDLVRRAVDRDPTPGRFILTGSAEPQGAAIHSGAGRIARLRMRPLSLAERGIETPTVSVRQLLDDPDAQVEGRSALGLSDYVHEIVASGLPGIRSLHQAARELQLDAYIANLAAREFPDQGVTVRNPLALTAWMRAYAAATASTASYSVILDAATPGEADKPSKHTAATYRDALSALWVTDPVPAWAPVFSSFGALGKSPKHFLLDPAIAARLLHLDERVLLAGARTPTLGPQAGTILGHLFEALVGLSLQTYATACGAVLAHTRTSTGSHEIDYIVDRGPDILAIEVKLAATVEDKDVRHLNWLPAHVPHSRVTRLIVTTGTFAYTRLDGVHVVPAGLLGP